MAGGHGRSLLWKDAGSCAAPPCGLSGGAVMHPRVRAGGARQDRSVGKQHEYNMTMASTMLLLLWDLQAGGMEALRTEGLLTSLRQAPIRMMQVPKQRRAVGVLASS